MLLNSYVVSCYDVVLCTEEGINGCQCKLFILKLSKTLKEWMPCTPLEAYNLKHRWQCHGVDTNGHVLLHALDTTKERHERRERRGRRRRRERRGRTYIDLIPSRLLFQAETYVGFDA